MKTGCLIVFGLIIVAAIWGVINNPNIPFWTRTESEIALNDNIRKSLKIKKINWHIGGFGTVMVADLTIENQSEYGIKDFTIDCRLSGKSGTKISSCSKTIYEILPAKTTKTFRRVNVGLIHPDSARASCEITHFEIDSFPVKKEKGGKK